VDFDDLDTVDTNTFSDTEATEGTGYTYRVTAVGIAGEGTGATVDVTTLPAGLVNLGVSSYTDTSVTLSWQDPSNGETGFKVERSTDGDFWEVLDTTAANATTFTDTTPPRRRRTCTASRRSMPATWRQRYDRRHHSPDRADGVDATVVSATAVHVVWNDNSAGETGYTVLRRQGSDDWSIVGEDPRRRHRVVRRRHRQPGHQL